MPHNSHQIIFCSLPDNIDFKQTVKDIFPSDSNIIKFTCHSRIINSLTFRPMDSLLVSLPGQRGKVCFPPCCLENGRRRMLNDYYEKEIGGVRYRVHSIFGSEGDFRELSEKLLESRVIKHYGESCAKDAAGS